MIATGKQLRDAAIERVLTPEEGWLDRYRAILLDWFDGRADGFRFSGETLRTIAQTQGLEEPHHYNAWSGGASSLIRAWLREQKIMVTGRYVLASSPKTHAHALREYEKVVSRRYRIAQAENQMELLA